MRRSILLLCQCCGVYCEYNLITQDYSIINENILCKIRISNLEKCEWGSVLVHSFIDINCDEISQNPAAVVCAWPLCSLVSALYLYLCE